MGLRLVFTPGPNQQCLVWSEVCCAPQERRGCALLHTAAFQRNVCTLHTAHCTHQEKCVDVSEAVQWVVCQAGVAPGPTRLAPAAWAAWKF